MMAVNVAAASTVGLPLNDLDFKRVHTICEEILKLD
jgi:hypothetical protein